MHERPLVSVIIPCFNLGRFLDEAVQSVLDQTVTDTEILIVDDGSTDAETIELLDAYERPRTTVFRTSNQGLANARNYLVERARGTYLCALDADDKLHPLFFEKALIALTRDSGLSFVSCWLQSFGEETWTWRPGRCDLPSMLAECQVVTAALVQRDAVAQAGAYDADMPHPGYEDWDLWLTLIERGHRGQILPEVLFYYRRRPGAMSYSCNQGQQRIDLFTYLVHKHAKSFEQHAAAVLADRDQQIEDLLRELYDLQAREVHLTSQLTRRQHELARLQRKRQVREEDTGTRPERNGIEQQAASLRQELDAAREALDQMEQLARRAHEEVCALRSSKSWQITSPLRFAYDRLHPRRP